MHLSKKLNCYFHNAGLDLELILKVQYIEMFTKPEFRILIVQSGGAKFQG